MDKYKDSQSFSGNRRGVQKNCEKCKRAFAESKVVMSIYYRCIDVSNDNF